jgi:DNA-binding Lrp family transcriptional regulator
MRPSSGVTQNRGFDQIDREIVAFLQENARRPMQEVGVRVGLTAPAVRRRVQRLEESNVVRGYTAVVDACRFGWSTLAITELMTEGAFSGRMVLEEIRKHPEVSGGWTVAGAASAILLLRARDTVHLEQVLDRLRENPGITRTETSVVLSALLERAVALGGPPGIFCLNGRDVDQDVAKTDLDQIDEQIVALLRADARSSFGSIGARVALSAPAVKRRVDRLQANGVIRGYTAAVDPTRFGWGTQALVRLHTVGTLPGRGVLDVVRDLPEVRSAYTVAGAASAVLLVRATDTAHLERTLESLVANASVTRTETAVILSTLVERPFAS